MARTSDAHCFLQSLNAILYDFDTLNADDEIGRISIPIRDLPHEQKQDLWLDIFDYAADAEANKIEASYSLLTHL